MNPELHAFFLNRAAASHDTHGDLVLSYRDLCHAVDNQLDLLPYVEAFDDFREDVRYARNNPDPDADPSWIERLRQFAAALTELENRRRRVKDFVIEVSQSHSYLEALRAEAAADGQSFADHPVYSGWLRARTQTLETLEEYRASPELRPHIDIVLDDDTVSKLDAITASIADSGPEAVRTASPAMSEDPARDERNRINETYRTLLAASGNDPQLIPYQDGFDDFRSTVSGAIQADRQPPQYMEKLRELDRRLQADIGRRETLAVIQRETIDLDAQLSWLDRTASTAGKASIADLPEYPGFARDAVACLERWAAFRAEPGTRPHIDRLADPALDIRVSSLSAHVSAPEPAPDRRQDSPQHPIVRDYAVLLEQAGNKPEFLAYQSAFKDFREAVRLARDDPSQHPDMARALARLSTRLDQSHEARATVANLQRRLTKSANEMLDIETWVAELDGRAIQDSPRYDAWRSTADTLIDEYHSMTRDSSLAPHINDRVEARRFLQGRIAFLSDDRFARAPEPSISEEEALNLARVREADQGIAMSM